MINVKFDPPPPELIPFFEIRDIATKDETEHQKCINAIIDTSQILSQRISNELPDFMELPDEDNEVSLTGKVLRNKFVKYTKKFLNHKKQYYSSVIGVLAKGMIWVNDSYELNINAEFKKDKFINKVDDMFWLDEKINYYTMKNQYLLQHLSQVLYITPKIEIEMLQELLSKESRNVDTGLAYAPEGKFEYVFRDFLYQNQMIKRFQIFADGLQKSKGSMLNLSDLKQVSTSILLLLRPQTQNEQIMIKLAIQRIGFEQVYIGFYNEFNRPNSTHFVERAAIFANKTPKDMSVESYFPPGIENLPFSEIIPAVPQLKQAVSFLNEIEFLFCPIDIIYKVFASIKLIESCCGGKGTSMSFDEIFDVFLPIFAYSPPANAEAVNNLLMRLSGLALSSSLDFSKLLLNSAIDALIDPEYDPDPHDEKA